MIREHPDETPSFLSTLSVGPRDQRLPFAVLLISAAALLALAPFAKIQLAPVAAFIPIYESALVINDLITAVLLFGQFRILRSRAMLVLASGYLFTAFTAVVHLLTFPGLFASTGLLGVGPQSTAWLYMFWHGGFPLFVIAYVLLKNDAHDMAPLRGRMYVAVAGSVVAVAILVCGLALLATRGADLLPAVMQGNRYTPAMITVVSSVWVLSLVALAALWQRCPHSALDIWLMAVMGAWLCDIALSAVLNGGRYDLGFYAGRIYGLLASGFVLAMLLLENGMLYARLADAHAAERQKSADLRQLSVQLETLNNMLDEKNRQLQEASRLKSEFLANMSHELRTPLNAIIGFSEVLKDGLAGELTEEQQDFTRQVFDSGRHLLELINDVLDLSKVEADKMPLYLEPLHVNKLLHDCIAMFAEQAMKRGIVLKFDIWAGDDRLAADPRKLRQILYNLLSNAMKFTPEGGEVRLSLHAIARAGLQLHAAPEMAVRLLPLPPGEFGEFLEIRIIDSGIGMQPEDLPKLFQTFLQIDSALTRRHEGTGLGLALASRLAALHGGTIGVASAPGKGTHFAVWLPWRHVDTADGASNESEEHQTGE